MDKALLAKYKGFCELNDLDSKDPESQEAFQQFLAEKANQQEQAQQPVSWVLWTSKDKPLTGAALMGKLPGQFRAIFMNPKQVHGLLNGGIANLCKALKENRVTIMKNWAGTPPIPDVDQIVENFVSQCLRATPNGPAILLKLLEKFGLTEKAKPKKKKQEETPAGETQEEPVTLAEAA